MDRHRGHGAERDETGKIGEMGGCAEYGPLLEAYYHHALAPDAARSVAEHAAGCSLCAAALERFAVTDQLIADAPMPAPGPELRQRLAVRIATARAHRLDRSLDFASSLPAERTTVVYDTNDANDQRETRLQIPTRAGKGVQRMRVPLGTAAAVLIVALLAGVLLTRGHVNGPQIGSANKTHTAQTAPKGWLATYLSSDGHLHYVSAGGQDVTGPTAPESTILRTPHVNVSAATSPNGRYLAYVEGSDPGTLGGPARIIDVRTGATITTKDELQDISWSPDSALLAGRTGSYVSPYVFLVNPRTGVTTSAGATYQGHITTIYAMPGWLDSGHVAVIISRAQAVGMVPPTHTGALSLPLVGGQPSDLTIGAMDIHTGTVRSIAALPNAPDVSLSPDGATLLLLPSQAHPMAESVDMRTGTIRQLPNISQAFNGKLGPAQFGAGLGSSIWALHTPWRTGSHTVAVSQAALYGNLAAQQPGVWLLDLDADNATLAASNLYPLGWWPGTDTLVAGSPPSGDASWDGGAGIGSTLYVLGVDVSPKPVASTMAVYIGLVDMGS